MTRLFALATLFALGCGSNPEKERASCVPGATSMCACSGTQVGVQSCTAEGVFDACASCVDSALSGDASCLLDGGDFAYVVAPAELVMDAGSLFGSLCGPWTPFADGGCDDLPTCTPVRAVPSVTTCEAFAQTRDGGFQYCYGTSERFWLLQ